MKEFAKIDVGLREHPKILRAGDDAGWLFVCAILWSKEHDAEGLLPDYVVDRLTGLRKPWQAVERLVNAGLLEPVENGWMIHDYLDHQESSAKRKAAARKAAAVRWGKQDASDPQSESHANRIDTAMRNRNAEEEEEEEKENPQPPVRVTFRGKPVPADRLELADRILADFNEANRSSYAGRNGRGQPTENLKRILGALTDAVPPLTFEEASTMTRWRLAHPFKGDMWDSTPHTGVVFGPGIFDSNRESARGGNGAGPASSADIAAALSRPSRTGVRP